MKGGKARLRGETTLQHTISCDEALPHTTKKERKKERKDAHDDKKRINEKSQVIIASSYSNSNLLNEGIINVIIIFVS